jgi:hypothetical protein
MKDKQLVDEIKKLEGQKEKIEKEISSLKIELNKESNNSDWISIDKDYEVTKEVLYKGKTYDEIMQLKKSDEELLTLKQIAIILEDKDLARELKMDSKYSTKDYFFFKQPFETNQENGYVAGFYSDSDGSDLVFGDGAGGSVSTLGVRFVRKKHKKVK